MKRLIGNIIVLFVFLFGTVILQAQSDSCSITSLPVFWDFESDNTSGTASNPLPACWSRPIEGFPYVYNNANTALSGTHQLRFFIRYNWYGVLPAIDTSAIDLQNCQLSFHINRYVSYSGPAIQVGVMVDPQDTSTFTAVYTVPEQASNYQMVDVPLNSYSGNGTYIALRNIGANNADMVSSFHIDDMILYPIPSCPMTIDLEAIHFTENSITVRWNHDVDSAQYIIHYKLENSDEWTTDTTGYISGATYTIDNLQQNATYSIFVQALCNPYLPTDTIKAATVCSFIDSLPMFWDFEEYEEPLRMPYCWKKIRTANDNGFPRIWPSATYAYYSNASFNFYNSCGTYVILPTLADSINLQDLHLTFYLRPGSVVNPEYQKIEIGVITNPSDSTTFTPVETVTTMYGYNGSYIFYDIDLSSYSGIGKNICFKDLCPLWGSQTELYMDNLTLDYRPICHHPDNLIITNISTHSAGLSWTGFNSYFPDYTLYYRPLGDTIWMTQTVSLTNSSILIDGLATNTQYEVFLIHDCNEIPSDTIIFTTKCEPLSDISIQNVTDNSAALECPDLGSADTLIVHYRIVGENDWQTISVSTDAPVIYGLSSSTTYELYVTIPCNLQDSSNIVTFTTDSIGNGISDYINEQIRVYPNPTNDYITIECATNDISWRDAKIEVFDIYGKLILSVVETCYGLSLQTSMNVSSFPTGIYFLRISTENKTITKNFIKQ